MAIAHARPLDVISIRPLGPDLVATPSTSLVKTRRLQLLHQVLLAHQEQPRHHVDDESTIQCLEGVLEVVTDGVTQRLQGGDMLLVPAKTPHSLRARTDCAVLVTLLLRDGDAAAQGAGRRAVSTSPP
jgi:quercetin dioxygenase-like cupin family protein